MLSAPRSRAGAVAGPERAGSRANRAPCRGRSSRAVRHGITAVVPLRTVDLLEVLGERLVRVRPQLVVLAHNVRAPRGHVRRRHRLVTSFVAIAWSVPRSGRRRPRRTSAPSRRGPVVRHGLGVRLARKLASRFAPDFASGFRLLVWLSLRGAVGFPRHTDGARSPEEAHGPGQKDQDHETDHHLAASDRSYTFVGGVAPVSCGVVRFERGARPFRAVLVRALAHVTPEHRGQGGPLLLRSAAGRPPHAPDRGSERLLVDR